MTLLLSVLQFIVISVTSLPRLPLHIRHLTPNKPFKLNAFVQVWFRWPRRQSSDIHVVIGGLGTNLGRHLSRYRFQTRNLWRLRMAFCIRTLISDLDCLPVKSLRLCLGELYKSYGGRLTSRSYTFPLAKDSKIIRNCSSSVYEHNDIRFRTECTVRKGENTSSV